MDAKRSSRSRLDFSNERPAYSVYPPAVARHLVFRLEAQENPRWEHDETLRRTKWEALCACLTNHLNAMRGAFGETDRVEIVVPWGETNETEGRFSARRTALVHVPSSRAMAGYRLRIRVDIYTEVYSISYVYDRVNRDIDGPLQHQLTSVYSNPAAADWLFDGVWSDPAMPGSKVLRDWIPEDGYEGECSRSLGSLVADFRSIVICPTLEWRMDKPSLTPSAVLDAGETSKLGDNILDFLSSHAPLIRRVASPHESMGDADVGGEAVVCGMLGGKALYASELGQWREVSSVIPVRHLLVYGGHSPAQLGRLLRRIYMLGEFRHAALLDYDLGSKGNDLRAASRELRVLGTDLDAASASPLSPSLAEAAHAQLRRIIERLGGISEMGEGGLIFRIEQSRYYAAQFRSTLNSMRIVRIGDWQPYDDFVERYINQLFARIDRIGNRYEALGRRLNRMLYFAQVEGMESYQGKVTETLHTIDEATKALKQADDRQVALLKNGELFAVLFSVYYGGSVIHDWFELKPEERFTLHGYYDVFWLAVTVLVGLWLVRRLRKSRREAP